MCCDKDLVCSLGAKLYKYYWSKDALGEDQLPVKLTQLCWGLTDESKVWANGMLNWKSSDSVVSHLLNGFFGQWIALFLIIYRNSLTIVQIICCPLSIFQYFMVTNTRQIHSDMSLQKITFYGLNQIVLYYSVIWIELITYSICLWASVNSIYLYCSKNITSWSSNICFCCWLSLTSFTLGVWRIPDWGENSGTERKGPCSCS